MSAPVDVLAVMRDATDRLSDAHAAALDEARAAVAELIAAIEADEEMPTFVEVDYRSRKPGEPERVEWWDWRRKQLEGDGYQLAYQTSNGTEHYILPAGMSDRTRSALARCKGQSA